MTNKAIGDRGSTVLRTRRSASSSISIVDLFSGCGGLSAGAVSAAVSAGREPRVALAVDNDPDAVAVYQNNFERIGASVLCADVSEMIDVRRANSKATEREVRALKALGNVDVVLAGPPCQGHSNLNNSSRRLDPRNLLYWAPVRAAMVLRPKVVLIENVPGVTLAQEGVIEGARKFLARNGYHVAESTIELVELGVPQLRKRHMLVATSKPFDIDEFLRRRARRKPVTVIDSIRGLEDKAGPDEVPEFRTTKLSADNVKRIDYLFDNGIFDLPDSMRPRCHRDKVHSYISMYGRMHPDRPAQTITGGFGSMGQGRFVHPTRRRMITAREAARLQGFDDAFSFSGVEQVTSLRRMIGNAVPPALSAALVGEFIESGHL